MSLSRVDQISGFLNRGGVGGVDVLAEDGHRRANERNIAGRELVGITPTE